MVGKTRGEILRTVGSERDPDEYGYVNQYGLSRKVYHATENPLHN